MPPDFSELVGKESADKWADNARNRLKDAVCFDVDNVNEYFYAINDQEYWEWESDFPSMAPPFETFWMEHGAATGIRTPKGFREFDRDLYAGAVGVLFTGMTYQEAGEKVWGNLPEKSQLLAQGWVLTSQLFVLVKGTGVVMIPCAYVFNIDQFGKPFKYPMIASPFSADSMMFKLVSDSSKLIFPHALAISFLHCKNVKTADVPDTRRPVEKRRDERRGVDFVTFKTLQIEPMKKVLTTEGGIAQNGLKKALHICRGHFSHYSEEKPLFGKYSGQFWIPSHVRGSAESGKVVKDYSVKAPKQTAA